MALLALACWRVVSASAPRPLGPPPPPDAADAPAQGLGGGEVPGERADRSAIGALASVGPLRSPLGGAQQVDASNGSACSTICSDSARLGTQIVQYLARNDAALLSGGTQAPPAPTASEGDGPSCSEGVFVSFLDGFSVAAVACAAKGPKSGVESLLDLTEARDLGVRLGGAGCPGAEEHGEQGLPFVEEPEVESQKGAKSVEADLAAHGAKASQGVVESTVGAVRAQAETEALGAAMLARAALQRGDIAEGLRLREAAQAKHLESVPRRPGECSE
ncbi:unnamed protein product [Prorocentrum cordatum]|uniref:Uncharacterized protein n=1 Tax=Prorocentrum cordatum TaxID=2364126 RepID=A0ABN9UK01_9DINO|nr:unnamed protein product [Polarella glacialis]